MSIPEVQSAIQVTSAKGDDWLEAVQVAQDVPVPSPGKGEVLIKMKLRPVHPIDSIYMSGATGFKPQSYPAIPGAEGMGTVAARGFGVIQPSIDSRVTAFWSLVPGLANGNGTFQEYIVVPAEYLIWLQNDITDDVAACLNVNPLTALGIFRHALKTPSDQYIAITGANGQLGKMLLGLCKQRKINAIAVVRRRDVLDEVKEAGACECVCSADEDVQSRINDITGGQGAWAAFDGVGGPMLSTLVNATREGGTVVSLRGLDRPATVESDKIVQYNLADDLKNLSEEDRKARLERALDFFRSGVFKVGESVTFPLKQAQDAFKAHGKEGRSGTVFISSIPEPKKKTEDEEWA